MRAGEATSLVSTATIARVYMSARPGMDECTTGGNKHQGCCCFTGDTRCCLPPAGPATVGGLPPILTCNTDCTTLLPARATQLTIIQRDSSKEVIIIPPATVILYSHLVRVRLSTVGQPICHCVHEINTTSRPRHRRNTCTHTGHAGPSNNVQQLSTPHK
jgi:hypothetical protein